MTVVCIDCMRYRIPFQGRVVLHGMLEVPCATPGEAFGCLDAGSRSRCVLPNSPNGGNDNCVNQSHGVFVVTLRQEWIEGKKKKKTSLQSSHYSYGTEEKEN
jgi:hypothetical protein